MAFKYLVFYPDTVISGNLWYHFLSDNYVTFSVTLSAKRSKSSLCAEYLYALLTFELLLSTHLLSLERNVLSMIHISLLCLVELDSCES